MKKFIKNIMQTIGVEVKRYQKPKTNFDDRVISLKAKSDYKGDVLLAFILDPFVSEEDLSISHAHTHHWESLQIAQTFLELGYAVDAIDFRNSKFLPTKDYAFFVSARSNLEIISKRLNLNCIKIVHLDTAHWLFNNSAAYQRCLELQQRRGVTLKSIKWVNPNWAIEHSDYATIIGNEFTISTYRYANKPILRTPISTLTTYPWCEDKNYEESRLNFLWFGSHGLVHKGLDIVLEAFVEMPECHLYVCGPIKDEREFNNFYNRELYKTDNIHTIGWVEVDDKEFKDILKKCICIVYPSCSEGGAGCVVQCMHAGLIPIVSYEASVNIDNFGIMLKENSIAEIKKSVKKMTKTPVEELKQKSRMTWEYARKHHTREQFASRYREVIKKVMKLTP